MKKGIRKTYDNQSQRRKVTDNYFNRLKWLVILSISAKIAIAFITTNIFHSFVDAFDIEFYFTNAQAFAQGGIPYVTFPFEYPVLAWIPIGIAFILSALFHSAEAFPPVFQLLMIGCDAVTTACVYLIGRKLWSNEKFAFIASLLYICSISAGYFVITKYDAFPTCLMMVGLTLTVYRKELYNRVSDYWLQTAGFFAKVFPIVVIPFTVLYNSKETSIRQEMISAAKPLLISAAIFILPLCLLNINSLRMYIPVRADIYGVYSNTLTFTIYSWLHEILQIGISITTVSVILYSAAIAGMLFLLYAAYREPKKNLRLLLKLILSAILLLVLSTSVRSPQYIVWFTPLLCLLAADDFKKICSVVVVQVIAFIEFPLLFRSLYTSTAYTGAFPSIAWYSALTLFTVEYLILIICALVIINPKELLSAHG